MTGCQEGAQVACPWADRPLQKSTSRSTRTAQTPAQRDHQVARIRPRDDLRKGTTAAIEDRGSPTCGRRWGKAFSEVTKHASAGATRRRPSPARVAELEGRGPEPRVRQLRWKSRTRCSRSGSGRQDHHDGKIMAVSVARATWALGPRPAKKNNLELHSRVVSTSAARPRRSSALAQPAVIRCRQALNRQEARPRPDHQPPHHHHVPQPSSSSTSNTAAGAGRPRGINQAGGEQHDRHPEACPGRPSTTSFQTMDAHRLVPQPQAVRTSMAQDRPPALEGCPDRSGPKPYLEPHPAAARPAAAQLPVGGHRRRRCPSDVVVFGRHGDAVGGQPQPQEDPEHGRTALRRRLWELVQFRQQRGAGPAALSRAVVIGRADHRHEFREVIETSNDPRARTCTRGRAGETASWATTCRRRCAPTSNLETVATPNRSGRPRDARPRAAGLREQVEVRCAGGRRGIAGRPRRRQRRRRACSRQGNFPEDEVHPV